MTTQKIGSVPSGKSKKNYEVRWNSYSREVFVNYAGGTKVGNASSSSEAMNVAEAWLYDK